MTFRPILSRCSLALVTVALMACSDSAALAQKKAPKTKGKVVDKTLTADDGFPIAITYYESTEGEDSPVVIMLHMKGSNRLVWKGARGVPAQLQARGYAVVTVDLRKHGDSRVGNGGRGKKAAGLRPRDYKAMVAFDLKAVKKFLLAEHQAKKLNIRKTGIVAAEMSTAIAALFTLADWLQRPYPDAPTPALSTPRGQDVRALVLISPVESMPGLNAGAAYKSLSAPAFRLAVLVGYGKGDVLDRGGKTAKRVYEKLASIAGNRKRMYLREYPTRRRGTDILNHGTKLELNINNFLDLHLKKLTDKWRDRRSKLNR